MKIVFFLTTKAKFLMQFFPAYAKSEGFLGITSLENDFDQHPDIITKAHQCGLLIGFYGDNVSENLEKFDDKMVDVAIYDRFV